MKTEYQRFRFAQTSERLRADIWTFGLLEALWFAEVR